MINSYQELDQAAIDRAYEIQRHGKMLFPLEFDVTTNCLEQAARNGEIVGAKTTKIEENGSTHYYTELMNGLKVILKEVKDGSSN